MRAPILEWARGLRALLWPAQCAACAEVVDEGAAFCAACACGIDPVGPACARCAQPAERALGACARCAAAPPAFASARAVGRYGGPLAEAILRLKHGRRLEVAAPLGALLAAAAPAHDVVVPVPLARGRLAARGFDQAGELARAMGGRVVHALARVRETPPQEGGPAERAANVRGAFQLRAAVAGRRVLLVDDVMTTGATAGACARVLRRGGAREVHVLTVARTAHSV